MPLLGFIACSGGDSGANAGTHAGDLPQGTAGKLATGGSGGTGASGGPSASAGAGGANLAGAFAQGGSSANAGSGGSNSNPNTGGSSGGGAGGVASIAGSGSMAGASSVGGSHAGGSAGALGTAGASAAFAKVSSILGSNCGIKGCHADNETPHFVPGPMLYATLTGPNTVIAQCGYTKLVEAGDPSKSALVRLMNRQCDGFTMPPSCNKTTCLATADLKALTDWIQAGAPP